MWSLCPWARRPFRRCSRAMGSWDGRWPIPSASWPRPRLSVPVFCRCTVLFLVLHEGLVALPLADGLTDLSRSWLWSLVLGITGSAASQRLSAYAMQSGAASPDWIRLVVVRLVWIRVCVHDLRLHRVLPTVSAPTYAGRSVLRRYGLVDLSGPLAVHSVLDVVDSTHARFVVGCHVHRHAGGHGRGGGTV